MKKTILLVVPALALLASCGSSDPMAAVKKDLPEDVEVVVPSEEEPGVIEEYVADTLNEMVNIFEEKAVYHLSANFSSNANGKMEGDDYRGSSVMKGDLYFGYETVMVEEKPFTSAFLKLENFTVQTTLSLPKEIKEKMPIPETFSLTNVSLYAFVSETPNGTYAYLDLSNHELQDYAKLVMTLNEVPEAEIEAYLDGFLGQKIEGSEYRPGLVYADVTTILEQFDLDEDLVAKPLSWGLAYASEAMSEIKEEIAEFADMFLEYVSPVVGVKYSDVGEGMQALEKTSLVLNVSSAEIAAAMEVPADQMPINGVAGLLVSVGMENGSEDYALEELNLSANISGSLEEISFAFNGSLQLTASYNEQAEMVVPTAKEIEQYMDITDVILGIIASMQ